MQIVCLSRKVGECYQNLEPLAKLEAHGTPKVVVREVEVRQVLVGLEERLEAPHDVALVVALLRCTQQVVREV